MAIPDNIDPNYVLDKSVQDEIGRLQQGGELAIQAWAKDARPASGWTPEAYWNATSGGAAVTPEFPGAQSRATAPGGWLDMANKNIGHAEGLSNYAYHGAYSSHRKNGVRVRDGHGSTEEVSVGYGFNMTRGPDARAAFKEIGLDDKAFDDVLNGRRSITNEQAAKLRENDILRFNAGLSRAIQDRPLRDHQRAALVSLAYNTGLAGARPILEAVKSGAPDKEVARLIATFKTGKDGKLANRRKHEASLWLGAQAEDFFRGVETNQIAQSPELLAEVNPRERR